MNIRCTAALAALVLATACGGGGFDVPSVPPDRTPPPVEPTPDPKPAPDPEPQGVSVSMVTETDGPSAAEVAEYLRVHASGGPYNGWEGVTWTNPPGLARFANLPTVHFATGTSERHRTLALHGIALANRVLPNSHHLQIGSDLPADVAARISRHQENGADIRAIPQGQSRSSSTKESVCLA